jgi:HAE1 family hydrophobic/amphiphilic exporter-1
MGMDQFPKIDYPAITVITSLENKSPLEIRNLVTIPMEEILASTHGLRNMKSISKHGESVIVLYFDWGVSMDQVYMDTREKLDFAKSIMPQGTSRPVALKYDPNSDPIMTIGLTIKNKNIISNSFQFLKKNLKPLLERIEGVSYLDIIGGEETQIKVLVELNKLFANKISIDQVVKALEENNIEYPVGYVEENDKEFSVNIQGKFKDIYDLGEVVVGRNEQGIPILLKTIASISSEKKDKNAVFYLNSKAGISLNIYKEGDANVVKTVDKISEALPGIMNKFTNDINYLILQDNSVYIKNSIQNIFSSIIIGMVLAFIVIYLFLKEMYSSLIVGLAIPISIIITIFFMFLFNIDLNLISLTGLSIGIGMLVDSNIVVIENIHNHGKSFQKGSSIIHAVQEITSPVISSILTNIAVFLPIVFVQGIASSIFKELALVVTFSMLSSLFSSLSITPALYELLQKRILKHYVHKENKEKFLEGLKTAYIAILKKVIDHPIPIFIILFLLFVVTIASVFFTKKEILPKLTQNNFSIDIKYPENYSIEKTEQQVSIINRLLTQYSSVKYSFSTIGNPGLLSSGSKEKVNNQAVVKVFLQNNYNPESELQKIKESVLTQIPAGEITFVENQNAFTRLFPSYNEVYLSGSSIDYIKNIADSIRKLLYKKGIKSINWSIEERETLNFNFDRVAINNMGLTLKRIAEIAEVSLNGKIATKLTGKDDYDTEVNVMLDKNILTSPESLYRILISTPYDENIPLSVFAHLTNRMENKEIYRYNQQEMVSLSIMDDSPDLGMIQSVINNLQLPNTVTVNFSWDTPEIRKSIDSLLIALILSVIIIFVIVSFQFESMGKSIIIMLSIPLVFIGVFPIFLITRTSINVISMIGLIVLGGIVVNNAIVLVDYFEQRKNEIYDLKQLILEGCSQRLRPILMTSLTTIISLIPLILFPGEGLEFQRILALTIISGFIVSSSITLFLIPLIYYNVEKGKR